MPSAQFAWSFDGTTFQRNTELMWHHGHFQSIQSLAQVHNSLLVLPGFINLHAHLELTKLHGLLPQGVPFPQWVAALKSLTSSWEQKDYEESVRIGLAQMLAAGTTTVLDVGNSKANWHQAADSKLRLYAILELIGLDPQISLPHFHQSLAEMQQASVLGGIGLSAHAPFSCAPELMNSVATWCKNNEFPFTIHLSESREEQELYATAGGAYRPWIDRVYAEHMFQQPIGGGVHVLENLDLPAANVIAHGNTLQRHELAWLAQRGIGLVHCPQSARWFGHPNLAVESCVQLGVKLCLGTDSLASAESLSLWDQLREFQQRYPYSMESLLAMVTRIPGSVLAAQGMLGVLQQNACADFIVMETPAGFAGSDWSWILDPAYPIQQVFINGTRRDLNA